MEPTAVEKRFCAIETFPRNVGDAMLRRCGEKKILTVLLQGRGPNDPEEKGKDALGSARPTPTRAKRKHPPAVLHLKKPV